MFGFRKHKAEEQNKIKEIISKIAELHQAFEETAGQMEEQRAHMITDFSQVMENTRELEKYTSANTKEELPTMHALEGISWEVKGAYDEYGRVKTLIEEYVGETCALLEENKRYITPTRNLSEAPTAMKLSVCSYERQLDEIAESGRTISLLALNAAIEAGRLGEEGKQFILATEEIRQIASACEEKTYSLQKEVQDSQDRIEELEENIQHLLALLKEGNIATNRLFRRGQEINKQIQNSAMRDFSEDIAVIRDKVVGMRNMNEEIARCGERNRMLLNDIQDDVQAQKNTLAELENNFSHLMDMAEEQLC